MKSFKIFLGIALILCGFCSDLHADIYCYVSKDGVRHFTNTPTSPQYRLYIKGRPAAPAPARLPNNFDDYITMASEENDLDFSLIKAMIKVESNFNKKAVSRKGAMGLMQIMPENLNDLAINDPFDPWQNIMGGSKYLRTLLDRFGGKIALALAAYNAGPTRVEEHEGIPPFQETQNYVRQVLRYANIIGDND
ncbi:MAG: lytic transglycosylase domain-containing protein [Desulfobacteraceae bacterium]|nr:lytic transglycosylase domain-containing protein [Desulfobacteraceae bacterium]MBU4055464.1 lytic transglycosylase domain-containing protein [Pseudomonadota bacterium]